MMPCEIFSCSFIYLIAVFDDYSRNLFVVIQGHTETIFDCQFDPDDADILATGSFDGTIKVWDITTLQPVSSDIL